MTQRTITKDDVDKYVFHLDSNIQRIYRDIYNDLISREDTLDDEFQLSARLYDVFWDYVEEKKNLGLLFYE